MSGAIDFSAIIPRVNIKAFTNIFHFLLKIDCELIIEASSKGMWLRALNDAKSAFVVVELDINDFFSHYSVVNNDGTSTDSVFSCKLFGKPVVNSLRNTRKTSSLVLKSRPETNEIILEFVNEPSHAATQPQGHGCNYFNVKRVHKFQVLHSVEILNATFEYPRAEVRYISAGAALLNSSLKHLYSGSEISCRFHPHCIRFRSYQPEASSHSSRAALDSSAEMSSEVVVHYSDVNEYSVFSQSQTQTQGGGQNPVEMVFCVKEFKSLLLFCEAMQAGEAKGQGPEAVGSDVLLQFTASGHPLRVTYSYSLSNLFGGGGDTQLFSVTLTLATLSSGDSSSHDMEPAIGAAGGGVAIPVPPRDSHRGGGPSELLRSQQTPREAASISASAPGSGLRSVNSSGYVSSKRSYNQLRRMLDGDEDEED